MNIDINKLTDEQLKEVGRKARNSPHDEGQSNLVLVKTVVAELERLSDPLREIKEAVAQGKTVQWRSSDKQEWIDYRANIHSMTTGDTWRIEPWSLPDPPAGKEWAHHFTGWTEEELKDDKRVIYRPLLRDEEVVRLEDQCRYIRTKSYSDSSWGEVTSLKGTSEDIPDYIFRTRRPLPSPPKMVPLEPCDVPPGSVFRQPHYNQGVWSAAIAVNSTEVALVCHNPDLAIYSYQELQQKWQISRDNGKTWSRCEKQEAPTP